MSPERTDSSSPDQPPRLLASHGSAPICGRADPPQGLVRLGACTLDWSHRRSSASTFSPTTVGVAPPREPTTRRPPSTTTSRRAAVFFCTPPLPAEDYAHLVFVRSLALCAYRVHACVFISSFKGAQAWNATFGHSSPTRCDACDVAHRSAHSIATGTFLLCVFGRRCTIGPSVGRVDDRAGHPRRGVASCPTNPR